MGNLTDDMTRLRGEIDALRNARGALLHDLAQSAKNLAGEVFAMRSGFAENQATETKKSKEDRRAVVSGMFSPVSSLLADFSSSHAAMARSDRAERGAFVADVKNMVACLRKNIADDIEGARRVWHGKTVVEKRGAKQAELKELKRRDAEARRLNEEQVRQAAETKRQEEEQRLLAAEAEARKLTEEELQQDAEVKRWELEEERRRAAEAEVARPQEAERRKKDESQSPLEKKEMPKPASKGRKGKK